MVRVDSRPSSWAHAVVESYHPSDDLWEVVVDATGDRARVPRLSVCFDSESLSLFVNRLHAAYSARTAAAQWTRFHTFLGCMPMDDVGAPSAETLRRCTDASLATATIAKSFTPSSSVVSALTKVGAALVCMQFLRM
jgi:hypothetical protein